MYIQISAHVVQSPLQHTALTLLLPPTTHLQPFLPCRVPTATAGLQGAGVQELLQDPPSHPQGHCGLDSQQQNQGQRSTLLLCE